MSQSLQKFIREIVDSSKLKGKIREEVYRELSTHVFDEEKELQLQGYSEEKIYSIITERFGNQQAIAQELRMTHTLFHWERGFPIALFTILGLNLFMGVMQFLNSPCTDGLAECVGGTIVGSLFGWIIMLPLSVFAIFLDPFAWLFLASTVGVALLGIGISYLPNLKSRFSNIYARGKAVLSVISWGIILQWLSIWTTYRDTGVDFQDYNSVMATAGFPLKVFDFPFPPMGSDRVPIEMWKPFYINYVIWMVVGVVIYFLIPKKIKTHVTYAPAIIMITLYLTVYSLGKILFAFD